MGALSVSSGTNNGNSSVKSEGGSTRRSLLGEKRDRDFDGHCRAGNNHSYQAAAAAASSLGKSHGLGMTLELAAPRTNSRLEQRAPLPAAESEYKTLKISELGTQLSDEDIEDGLFHEFKKFGDVSVKISRSNDERIAFVNFRKPEDARAAKHARGRLVLYDRPLKIEAVYINRRRSRSPVERDPYEVDIKRPTRGQISTYGFLKFENLDMAHRAKLSMSGKILGRNPIKIGYGKATPTTRLWVGGLGPWVPLAALAREFDRFGTIRTIDYRKGDTWAYIQYESLDAAQAACTHMRGFPLGGPERRLRPLPLPPFDMVAEQFVHRATPEPLRVRERTPPPLHFRERELFPGAEWANPAMRERMRASPFEPLEHLERERRPREPWSLERELQGRDPARKRRLMEDGRHLDGSPGSTERQARRRRASPDGSPGGSSRDGGRFSDSDRPPRGERPSPGRECHSGLERGAGVVERRLKNQGVSDRGPSGGGGLAIPGERKRKADGGGGGKGPVKRERSESSSRAGVKPEGSRLAMAWHGMLLLKNSNFPANMHLLEGDHEVAGDLLVHGQTGRQVNELKITQRLRLDQPKLDEVSRRIKVAGPGGYAILLAVPGAVEETSSDSAASTQRPLRNLVSYLKQKQAAGVISLPVGGSRDKDSAGVLHAFPPCDFSQQFLDFSAKALAKTEEDYLVMIVVRGAS
ncbi:hypothetical protein CRUP_034062 [Coryphaenoides rupestris]|nr:hypothetical protein CRUP_034062 [Coryphaenoides rupestris]